MNKKMLSRAMALALAGTLALAGCGENTTTDPGSGEAAGGGKPITDLVISKGSSRELESFNMLYSQRNEDFENLTNLWDGLLEVDPKGKLAPAIADTWGTEDDGKTWKFHIRDGVKWVDVNGNEKADCNAYDFATGLEWICNFHKNDGNNSSMPFETIEGAAEYYEYTKGLSAEEAKALKAGEGSKFNEMVGIEVPDASTVIYTCTNNLPYFDTLGAYVALYPISQALIDELGVDGVKAMDNNSMWYNGAYTMTTFVHGNEKIFTKNPKYWDTVSTRFDTVRIVMVESGDVAFQLYDTGEIDYVPLTEANVKTISENENHKFHDYIIPDVSSKFSYQIHFNYDKKLPDGSPDVNWNKAVANEAFRRAIYYGVDLTDYNKRTNMLDPYSCQNNFYTMKGLVYKSDGTEYTELVRKNLGLPADSKEKMIRVDAAKAAEFKKQAMEELTAIGVTFPVQLDHYIKAGSQSAADSAAVFKKCFETALGTDFITVKINEFISSNNKEVVTPQLASIQNNGWGADYGDPLNYLGQETLKEDTAYYSNNYSNIVKVQETAETKALLDTYKEYTRLVDEAAAIIDDLDARYEAFAKAEAYLIEHALVIPLNYGNGLALGKIDNSSRMNAMFGCCNDKMKNWKTNDAGYTTEQANAAQG